MNNVYRPNNDVPLRLAILELLECAGLVSIAPQHTTKTVISGKAWYFCLQEEAMRRSIFRVCFPILFAASLFE